MVSQPSPLGPHRYQGPAAKSPLGGKGAASNGMQLSHRMSQFGGYDGSSLLEDETLTGLEEPPELPAASQQLPVALQHATPAPSVFPGEPVNPLEVA